MAHQEPEKVRGAAARLCSFLHVHLLISEQARPFTLSYALYFLLTLAVLIDPTPQAGILNLEIHSFSLASAL